MSSHVNNLESCKALLLSMGVNFKERVNEVSDTSSLEIDREYLGDASNYGTALTIQFKEDGSFKCFYPWGE